MRKILAIVILLFTMPTSWAITVEDVFNAFPDADNVQRVELNKAMLLAMNGGENVPEMDGINIVEVVNIKEPTAEQFSAARQLLAADIDGMDMMLDVTEHGENVAIYSRNAGDTVNQLLIVVVNDRSHDNEVVIIKIDGTIDIDNVSKLIH